MAVLTRQYVLKRFGMFLLTVWFGLTLIFIIPRLAPGDPVSAMIGRLTAQAIVMTTMGFWALGMRGMMITTDGEDYMILGIALAVLIIDLLYPLIDPRIAYEEGH